MKPYRLTIHCSVTPNGREYPLEQLRSDHKKRGFKDIGYHLVIQPDGSHHYTRNLMEDGAHVQGSNQGNIGVCLVGTDKFTVPQWDTLRYHLDSIVSVYDIPLWEIYCHHQFQSAIHQGKTCPNVSINCLLAWYIGNRHKAIEKHIFDMRQP